MENEKKDNGSNPGLLFEFEMEKRLQCTQCHRVKYQIEKDTILNL